ncbi:MAG: hypothetical protein DRP01_08815 [Archaeoglobales archaeon]|nr:MAG: hypothetical protein DRP01_08815 [Archaeoglobales archaeon]
MIREYEDGIVEIYDGPDFKKVVHIINKEKNYSITFTYTRGELTLKGQTIADIVRDLLTKIDFDEVLFYERS